MDQPALAGSAKPLEFRGTGREYFGIWIVNLLLSIVTLGFYIPWARVRTRRYFHRNTLLDGHSFDYVADPKRLLIGYLIVGAFFILYVGSGTINPLLALPVILVFWAALPWLRYKSARFFAANSTYRNLRFRFEGTLGGAYAAYLGWPMLSILTLGLLAPLSSFKKAEYFFGHFAYGNFRSVFTGRVGWFFKVLYSLVGIALVSFVIFIAAIVALALQQQAAPGGARTGASEEPPIWAFAAGFGIYGFMFLLAGVWIVLSKNYCWNHLVVNPGPAQIVFRSRLEVVRYLWIVFSNVVLTILTVSLFAPFAAVRIYRYRLDHLAVSGSASLDEVVAAASTEQNAMGDSASDLFDFEFGL